MPKFRAPPNQEHAATNAHAVALRTLFSRCYTCEFARAWFPLQKARFNANAVRPAARMATVTAYAELNDAYTESFRVVGSTRNAFRRTLRFRWP